MEILEKARTIQVLTAADFFIQRFRNSLEDSVRFNKKVFKHFKTVLTIRELDSRPLTSHLRNLSLFS